MDDDGTGVPKSLGRQLNFTSGAANDVVARLLDPHGLSLAQWAVLVTLWRNGPLPLKDIAEMTGNAPPATSRIVERMVGRGLVHRTVSPGDRRSVTISLSEAGENLRRTARIWEEVNAILLGGMNGPEREALFATLAEVEQRARSWLAGDGTTP